MMRSPNINMVTRGKLVDHRCRFQAMGMTHRPKFSKKGKLRHLRALGVCRTRCCRCRDACNQRATQLLNLSFIQMQKYFRLYLELHLISIYRRCLTCCIHSDLQYLEFIQSRSISNLYQLISRFTLDLEFIQSPSTHTLQQVSRFDLEYVQVQFQVNGKILEDEFQIKSRSRFVHQIKSRQSLDLDVESRCTLD